MGVKESFDDIVDTLTLMCFYGYEGMHYEDSRVVDMAQDNTRSSKSLPVTFIRLLRAVHNDWIDDRKCILWC